MIAKDIATDDHSFSMHMHDMISAIAVRIGSNDYYGLCRSVFLSTFPHSQPWFLHVISSHLLSAVQKWKKNYNRGFVESVRIQPLIN